MNVRYLGGGTELAPGAWLVPAISMGAFAIAGLMVVSRIVPKGVVDSTAPVAFTRVQEIVANRCITCHSAHPMDDVFHSPPAGVMFDTPSQIKVMAHRINLRAVEQQNMPFNNKTGITAEERGQIGRWYRDGARIEAIVPPR
jgi:uncharacterized membrane protein